MRYQTAVLILLLLASLAALVLAVFLGPTQPSYGHYTVKLRFAGTGAESVRSVRYAFSGTRESALQKSGHLRSRGGFAPPVRVSDAVVVLNVPFQHAVTRLAKEVSPERALEWCILVMYYSDGREEVRIVEMPSRGEPDTVEIDVR